METAIKKAIEGGYPEEATREHPKGKILRTEWLYPRLWLDPLFWQCLGKSLGWSQDTIGVCEDCGSRKAVDCHCEIYAGIIDEWLYHWHRFIDHLAAGNPPDSFFDPLIK